RLIFTMAFTGATISPGTSARTRSTIGASSTGSTAAASGPATVAAVGPGDVAAADGGSLAWGAPQAARAASVVAPPGGPPSPVQPTPTWGTFGNRAACRGPTLIVRSIGVPASGRPNRSRF